MRATPIDPTAYAVIKAWQAYGNALQDAIETQARSMDLQSSRRGREWLGYIADELRRAQAGARQVLDSALDEAAGDLLAAAHLRGR